MSSMVRHSETRTLGLTSPGSPDVAEMEIRATDLSFVDYEGDLLVIGVASDILAELEAEMESFQSPSLVELDKHTGGILKELATEDEFKGTFGQSTSVVRLSAGKQKRVVLIGLGKASDSSQMPWRMLGMKAANTAKISKLKGMGIGVVGFEHDDEAAKLAAVEEIAIGVILGTYEDTRFKSQAKPSALSKVSILSLGMGPERDTAVWRAVNLTAGIIVTKQLVSAPANIITPGALADAACSIAAAHGDVLSVTVLERADCESLGMGAYLAVTEASDLPPKFIHMKYVPPGGNVYKRVAVIGKGLTHDTGGYNIKTGAGCLIEMMKYDMGGGGAVLGAAKAIGAIKPKGIEVHFITAACENMISGHGMRPGDVVTASNGKTIEVNNTDAEGRLTLADALVYASRLHVDAIVDLATLTGACIVALGDNVAGLWSPSDKLADQLLVASRESGDKLWRMPMEDSYKDSLKSGIADLVNSAGRPGGAIKAALFLREFVDENIEWAHLDIAGPVWDNKKVLATGYGVGLLVKWVMGQEQE